MRIAGRWTLFGVGVRIKEIAVRGVSALCLVGACFLTSHRAVAGCAEVDAAIDAALAGFREWKDLHAAFTRFDGCDDGAISEGYSDSAVKLLAHHWDRLSELKALAESDPPFRHFVISHIDATTDPTDLTRIVVAARERCPKSEAVLCGEVRAAAERALRD